MHGKTLKEISFQFQRGKKLQIKQLVLRGYEKNNIKLLCLQFLLKQTNYTLPIQDSDYT